MSAGAFSALISHWTLLILIFHAEMEEMLFGEGGGGLQLELTYTTLLSPQFFFFFDDNTVLPQWLRVTCPDEKKKKLFTQFAR